MNTSSVLIELLNDEDFDALNDTVRWNGTTRIKDESVSHHSFLATMFGRIMLETLIKSIHPNRDLVRLQILTKIIFHDFDEMFSGDINHVVKYNEFNGKNIRKSIDDYCIYRTKQKFSSNSDVDKMFLRYILGDKGEPEYYHTVLKIADWLACLFYVNKEIKIGNKDLTEKYYYAMEGLKKQAHKLIKELKGEEYYDTMIIEDIIRAKFPKL